MNPRQYVFTSESVSEGHPDKVCDYIADSILDAHLAQDPQARVACEVLCKGSNVILAGEISSAAMSTTTGSRGTPSAKLVTRTRRRSSMPTGCESSNSLRHRRLR